MLKSILQGKWMGHPLHPALVHLPVGLWPAALVFDILSWYGIGGNTMVRLAMYAILFGLAAAVLAIPAGVADWLEIKKGKPAWNLGVYHMAINIFVVVLYAVNVGLRWETFRHAPAVEAAPLIISIIAVVLLFVGGYLGGRMVYHHGVAVARMSKKRWRKDAEKGGANLPEEKK